MTAQWFLTGLPGVGKTTVCLKIAELLRTENVSCGGVISREIRSGNTREGFEFIDLQSGESFPLSSTSGQGPKVGKYHVNLQGIRRAIKAVEFSHAEVIFLDEIGPMELKSSEFSEMVETFTQKSPPPPTVIVIHRSLASRYNCVQVTQENRDSLPLEIAREIMQSIPNRRFISKI